MSEPKAPAQKDRVAGTWYLVRGGKTQQWDGKRLVCKHNILPSACRECGGGIFCEHGKRRTLCVSCKGGALCQHNRPKAFCALCKGSSFCLHGRLKYKCKECGGSAWCQHKRIKSSCKKCTPSFYCQHNRSKTQCTICAIGGSVCSHGKRKSHCLICDIAAHPEHWCTVCKSANVRNSRFKPVCGMCYRELHPDEPITRKYRFKENYLHQELLKVLQNQRVSYNQTVPGGATRRRPDWLIDRGTHVIIIECDEKQHSHVDTASDDERTMQLFQDAGSRPTVFLRFNPDGYTDRRGAKVKGCFEFTGDLLTDFNVNQEEFDKRFNELVEMIQYFTENIPDKNITIEYLFYDATGEEEDESDTEEVDEQSNELSDDENANDTPESKQHSEIQSELRVNSQQKRKLDNSSSESDSTQTTVSKKSRNSGKSNSILNYFAAADSSSNESS